MSENSQERLAGQSVNKTAARSCSTSPFWQPTAMCAPEVSMVEIGAGARKKATEGDQNRELKTVVVSLPALYLTPPTLLKMRKIGRASC